MPGIIMKNSRLERKDNSLQSVSVYLYFFREKMKSGGSPERSFQEKRYLKSPFKFFGTSLPYTDKVAKEFRKENPGASYELVIALAGELWASEYHDEKRLALRLLQFFPEYLHIGIVSMLEKMLMESTTWDLVAAISIHLVGTVLETDKKAYAFLRKWSRSENFWMKRASLISQILMFRKGRGDRKLFCEFAEKMISEREYFIRKAIGWCIREIAKADSEEAFDFLMRIKDRASGLTLREGSKRLPEGKRKRILKKP
jgi:3-methyladenine DNA glycosylase AlkD